MRILTAASKHPFREINCSCKNKCNIKVNLEQRRKIHEEFWQLDANTRRNFIYHRVYRSNKNQSTIGHVSRRDSTFAYSLVHPESNEEISVCKVFFLTTLGFHPKNDAVVMSVMTATPRNASTAVADKRGKHPPSNKMDVTEIRQHILSHHPQISHYRREHAPKRKYLPNDLTIRSMHADYLDKFPDNLCSYETYRKSVSDENISFTKLGEEQCEVCLLYYNSHDINTCRMNVNAQSQEAHRHCDACLEWRNHTERAREARKQYRQHADAKWSDDYSVRSVDLQKVMLIPTMPGCKTAVFTSRVVGFNETFALMGKYSKANRKNLVVAWHEATAGRKAEEIAAAYLTALKYDRNVTYMLRTGLTTVQGKTRIGAYLHCFRA